MKEYKLTINGNKYNVVINDIEDTLAEVEVNGTPYKVTLDRPAKKAPVRISRPNTPAPKTVTVSTPKQESSSSDGHAVTAPLPGVILDICVKEGDMVKAGQKLIVLEAMKMENNIEADKDGKVVSIKVSKGNSVLEGAPLVILG